MWAFLLRWFAPSSVDGALTFLTTAIGHLEDVVASHSTKSAAHTEAINRAIVLKAKSEDEIKRASIIKTKLSALVEA